MPLPFIEVALEKDRDDFRRPDDVEALLSASGRLVQHGLKPVALPPVFLNPYTSTFVLDAFCCSMISPHRMIPSEYRSV
ncbi:hypothetical protein BD626DRAFT_496271 [Schizophyllum amplum]|uniref:Uncharacterized protein n=1 Tax=Schizophyllum amplum TaxID=97359 RepID=A0A550CEU3_9AGAR|nr:hypothetical protein BD626DRAFT_496271 [Auriculariopsis ampla]